MPTFTYEDIYRAAGYSPEEAKQKAAVRIAAEDAESNMGNRIAEGVRSLVDTIVEDAHARQAGHGAAASEAQTTPEREARASAAVRELVDAMGAENADGLYISLSGGPPPSPEEMAAMVGGEENGNSDDEVDHSESCPGCGCGTTMKCRCQAGHRQCEKGHDWVGCEKHGPVLAHLPSDGSHPTCGDCVLAKSATPAERARAIVDGAFAKTGTSEGADRGWETRRGRAAVERTPGEGRKPAAEDEPGIPTGVSAPSLEDGETPGTPDDTAASLEAAEGHLADAEAVVAGDFPRRRSVDEQFSFRYHRLKGMSDDESDGHQYNELGLASKSVASMSKKARKSLTSLGRAAKAIGSKEVAGYVREAQGKLRSAEKKIRVADEHDFSRRNVLAAYEDLGDALELMKDAKQEVVSEILTPKAEALADEMQQAQAGMPEDSVAYRKMRAAQLFASEAKKSAGQGDKRNVAHYEKRAREKMAEAQEAMSESEASEDEGRSEGEPEIPTGVSAPGMSGVEGVMNRQFEMARDAMYAAHDDAKKAGVGNRAKAKELAQEAQAAVKAGAAALKAGDLNGVLQQASRAQKAAEEVKGLISDASAPSLGEGETPGTPGDAGPPEMSEAAAGVMRRNVKNAVDFAQEAFEDAEKVGTGKAKELAQTAATASEAAYVAAQKNDFNEAARQNNQAQQAAREVAHLLADRENREHEAEMVSDAADNVRHAADDVEFAIQDVISESGGPGQRTYQLQGAQRKMAGEISRAVLGTWSKAAQAVYESMMDGVLSADDVTRMKAVLDESTDAILEGSRIAREESPRHQTILNSAAKLRDGLETLRTGVTEPLQQKAKDHRMSDEERVGEAVLGGEPPEETPEEKARRIVAGALAKVGTSTGAARGWDTKDQIQPPKPATDELETPGDDRPPAAMPEIDTATKDISATDASDRAKKGWATRRKKGGVGRWMRGVAAGRKRRKRQAQPKAYGSGAGLELPPRKFNIHVEDEKTPGEVEASMKSLTNDILKVAHMRVLAEDVVGVAVELELLKHKGGYKLKMTPEQKTARAKKSWETRKRGKKAKEAWGRKGAKKPDEEGKKPGAAPPEAPAKPAAEAPPEEPTAPPAAPPTAPPEEPPTEPPAPPAAEGPGETPEKPEVDSSPEAVAANFEAAQEARKKIKGIKTADDLHNLAPELHETVNALAESVRPHDEHLGEIMSQIASSALGYSDEVKKNPDFLPDAIDGLQHSLGNYVPKAKKYTKGAASAAAPGKKSDEELVAEAVMGGPDDWHAAADLITAYAIDTDEVREHMKKAKPINGRRVATEEELAEVATKYKGWGAKGEERASKAAWEKKKYGINPLSSTRQMADKITNPEKAFQRALAYSAYGMPDAAKLLFHRSALLESAKAEGKPVTTTKPGQSKKAKAAAAAAAAAGPTGGEAQEQLRQMGQVDQTMWHQENHPDSKFTVAMIDVLSSKGMKPVDGRVVATPEEVEAAKTAYKWPKGSPKDRKRALSERMRLSPSTGGGGVEDPTALRAHLTRVVRYANSMKDASKATTRANAFEDFGMHEAAEIFRQRGALLHAVKQSTKKVKKSNEETVSALAGLVYPAWARPGSSIAARYDDRPMDD